jgi:hypothetical protein
VRRIVSFLLGAALVLAVGGAIALLRAERGPARLNDFGASPRSTFSRAEARAFTGWPLFNVGASFEGMPLTAVLRQRVTNPFDPEVTRIRPNYVSFIYGDCRPEGETGCAPPLEIQISPACGLRPSDIQLPAHGLTHVRGVPAAFYEEGAKMIFATRRSTVAIYGRSRHEVVRAARRLRGVNVRLAADEPLPAPAAETRAGAARC